jgi:hypothetical protein
MISLRIGTACDSATVDTHARKSNSDSERHTMPGHLVSQCFFQGLRSVNGLTTTMVGKVTIHCAAAAAFAILHLPLNVISVSPAINVSPPPTTPAPLTDRNRHDITRGNDERDPATRWHLATTTCGASGLQVTHFCVEFGVSTDAASLRTRASARGSRASESYPTGTGMGDMCAWVACESRQS